MNPQTLLRWPLRLLLAVTAGAGLFALQSLLPRFFNEYIVDTMMLAGINIILAVSLNLINGITGQFSLGHAGFMAIGAYSSACFTRYAGPQLALPGDMIFGIALLLAALAAGLAGWLVGLPSLRLRGDYLAIVTLGFGQIIIGIIVTVEQLGGALGFSDLPTYTNFVWLFALVILCVLSARNLADSNLGRSMRAVREDEVAAEAVGVDTTRTKVLAFIISSMWAGIAGGLLAHYLPSIQPDMFNFQRSIEVVVMVVLGGLGSITGATLAAVLLKIMDEALRSVNGTFWVGVALIVTGALLAWPMARGKSRPPRADWLRWICGPALALVALLALFRFGRSLIESGDTPGNAAAWLRLVIYALILIVLMLLRPQGLLGRGEFGWHLFRKRRQPNQQMRDDMTRREPAEEDIAGTLP